MPRLQRNSANPRMELAPLLNSNTPILACMHLLTNAIRRQLPPLYANEDKGTEALAIVKLFTPDSSWTWYASEFDGDDLFFGLAVGVEPELGYFRLSELQTVRGRLGLPVERDRFFKPTPLRELLDKHEQGHY
jgi:Protein of unknown function (DUF2958)